MRKSPTKLRDRAQREAAISKISTEMTSFAMAANKVFEFRDWARSLGLFDGVDFSPLDQFPRQDVRDLRNMREHEIDYLQGEGRAQDRWFTAARPNRRCKRLRIRDRGKARLPKIRRSCQSAAG